MNESYIYAIAALLPLTAIMLVLQVNPYSALVIRGILGAVAALLYAVLGAPDVALTEALVGTMLAITLYAVAVRSSMVMRLGVLAKEGEDGSRGELMTALRRIVNKRQMRLELVSYVEEEELRAALQDKDIHGTCLREGESYSIVMRLQRLYQMVETEPIALPITLTCTENSDLQEKQ
ncbi:DUF4040 domain-containing protein [Spirulina sp. 06S082]|uniref:DUF4040 domain-containing protein n=1 Tax=Spirulina sp. 06S082 TaxID=3110248 RepID=UPI002B20FDD1|nr:DUF4040 domain-containing protein [Spirulina sp. 06S082]MEA5469210.1 DUF4040 domain-containing protein [Spirulina sp. 06S082]